MEAEGPEREGIDRSISEVESEEVPKETMSRATLFFLSFLPSYCCAIRYRMSAEKMTILFSEEEIAHFD